MHLAVHPAQVKRDWPRRISEMAHRIRYAIAGWVVPELNLELDLRLKKPRIHLALNSGDEPFEFFLASIEASLDASLHLPALTMALLIPDIIGQVEYSGESSSVRYPKWFDDQFQGTLIIDGHACYALRCKLLHEASLDVTSARAFAKSRLNGKVSKIIIAADNAATVNMGGIDPTVLDGPTFCRDLVSAARGWLQSATEAHRTAAANLVSESVVVNEGQFYSAGLAYIGMSFNSEGSAGAT